MSPLDEETIEASLARINAGLRSAGSQEVFEQYEQGVYLNKPFRLYDQAYEVAHALGGKEGHARVERDQDPNQNAQYRVRLLKPNEITNDMVSNATGVMDQMRKLEHETQQEPEPDEETIAASLARINAGLQSRGSQEVFEQYEKGVYLNKPFRRNEDAYEVARALGAEQGHTRVEHDQGPSQQDQYWVRLLKPDEITDGMIRNATSVMSRIRSLEYETQQEPEPAEPQFRHVSAVTPTEEVVSTTSLKEIELTEKSAHLPGYEYGGGQQLNTIFEVGDGGHAKTVAIKGIRGQRDAMLELHSDGLVAIHVDAADAMGGINDYTRYMTTRNDQDLFQPGGPLVVEFTKEELAEVASVSTMDAGQFGKRTVITYKDNRSLNVMAGDVQIALKTGSGEITKPVSASVEALSTLARTQGERTELTTET